MMTDVKPAIAGPASKSDVAGFCFFDPGPLVDGDLELVSPGEQWTEAMLEACRHPLTREVDPEQGRITREQIEQFLRAAPAGHERGDRRWGRVPTYHFWMRLRPEYAPPVTIAGSISLRVGHTEEVEWYYGHIGYGVFPPARGQHYAERACRLLRDLARRHNLNPLWITTDPENGASRHTCERLGARLVEIVHVPWGHPLYSRGQKRKCRFCLEL